MKKTSLLAIVPAVMLSGLLLGGCGMFRSSKAWNTALQESPLEIPPSLDTPQASAALVIPPRGRNQPTASGATATAEAPEGVVADGFVVAGGVDDTYQRVGKLLQDGKLGELISHDDVAHTYVLRVAAAKPHKKGFHLFSRNKRNAATATGSNPSQVTVSVAGSGVDGSQVRAQGSVGAVAKVVDALKSSLEH